MRKNIPRHEKPVWNYSDMFSDGAQVVCYYHKETEFLEWHKHKFYEINIIVEGKGTHLLGERSCEAAEGSVFVIPPGVDHAYSVDKAMVIFHILLSGNFFDSYRDKLQELTGYSLLFEIEPYIRGQFSENIFLKLAGKERQEVFARLAELLETTKSTYSGKHVLSEAFTLSVIGILCRNMTKQNPSSEREMKTERKSTSAISVEMVRIMEYIHENLSEKIRYEQLAEEHNMTYTTFLRQFKKMTKATPLAYQNACRMDKAKHLLVHTTATISFVAAECGFYDSSHFIRFFEKGTGKTPLAYREEQQMHR